MSHTTRGVEDTINKMNIPLKQSSQEETSQETLQMNEDKDQWDNQIHKWTKLKLKDGSMLDIPRHYALGGMTKRIINASDDGFCSILVTGISSSGKTSLVKNIMHNIHTTEGNPKFIFKWLHSEDLKSFDTFLKDLEPYNNYFVVLDDASFVADAEGVSKNQMAKIGMELTRVRHRLQGGRMIVCIINHALTSVQKSVFRNTTFTIATSMVSNARKGLEELFGNRYMINGFAKHYRTQVLDHKVSIPISSYEKKYLNLDTKKVRIAIAQEVNWIHYFIFEDVSCEICNQDYYSDKDSKYKSPLTPSAFLAEVNKVYGIHNLSSTIRWFYYMKTGDSMALHANQRKHLRLINKLAEKSNFDFKEVIEKLDERRTRKRKLKRWTKEEETDLEKNLVDKASGEADRELHDMEDK